MGIRLFSLLLVLFCFEAQSVIYTSETSNPSLKEEVYFKYPGPNCFGTALKASGVYENFRGVDVEEFEEVLEKNCERVSKPIKGDIGVFGSPDSSLISHAFVFLSEELAYEKQGVDYFDQSPAKEIKLSHLIYRAEASSECRRWGDSTCFNKLSYFRCSKEITKPEVLVNFEINLEEVLLGNKKLNAKKLRKDFLILERIDYISNNVLLSIQKQLEFIFKSEN